MIVGKGLIASLFCDVDVDDVIYFASGVSNSSETDTSQFMREENLVRKNLDENPDKLFIYFSTCSIYDSSKTNSLYVLHKLHMEELVKTMSKKYLILRVSNAVGKGGNPNLLMNYIKESITSNKQIMVYTKATRNLIDTKDIKALTLKLIEEKNYNKIVNIAYPENFSIIEILETFEKSFENSIDLKLERKGESYNIDISDIEQYFIDNQLDNKKKYLSNLILSYYKN